MTERRLEYTLYDREGKALDRVDTEDKGRYCIEGEEQERQFVDIYGSTLGIKMNPEKEENKYAPDFVYYGGGYADLKGQHTPFFTAGRYGVNPRHAVVFGEKDRIRYLEVYDGQIDIIFYVDWQVTEYRKRGLTIQIFPLIGVWVIPFKKLEPMLTDKNHHVHLQRVEDTRGNDKSNYVLDLRHPDFKWIV